MRPVTACCFVSGCGKAPRFVSGCAPVFELLHAYRYIRSIIIYIHLIFHTIILRIKRFSMILP